MGCLCDVCDHIPPGKEGEGNPETWSHRLEVVEDPGVLIRPGLRMYKRHRIYCGSVRVRMGLADTGQADSTEAGAVGEWEGTSFPTCPPLTTVMQPPCWRLLGDQVAFRSRES